MKKRLVSGALVLVGFVLGVLAVRAVGGTNPATPSAEMPDIVFPAAALKQWFPPVSEYETGGQPLDDEGFEALMAALDVALNAEETLADFGVEGDIHLWNFVRRLVRPRITEAQSETIAAYMEELQARHPDHSNAIAHHAASLTVLYADAMPSTPVFSWGPGSFQSASFAFDSITDGGVFTDAHVDALLTWIHTALTMPETANDFGQEASRYFGELSRILQRAELTDQQNDRVFALMDEIKASNEEFAETVDKELNTLRSLIPGWGGSEHRGRGHRRNRIPTARLPREHRGSHLLGTLVRAMPGGIPLPSLHARAVQGQAGRAARSQQRRGPRDDSASEDRRGT